MQIYQQNLPSKQTLHKFSCFPSHLSAFFSAPCVAERSTSLLDACVQQCRPQDLDGSPGCDINLRGTVDDIRYHQLGITIINKTPYKNTCRIFCINIIKQFNYSLGFLNHQVYAPSKASHFGRDSYLYLEGPPGGFASRIEGKRLNE